MSLIFYKVIHVLGVLGIFVSLGGVVFYTINGGTRDGAWRKGAAILHGIGMALVLVAGFGMLARLGIMGSWPGWVWAKLVLWFLMGGMLALVWRKPEFGKFMYFFLPVLGALGAYLALYKPF